jgi:hypothetical protein
MTSLAKSVGGQPTGRVRKPVRTLRAASRQQILPSGSEFVMHFLSKNGLVDVDLVADVFRMTKAQLAETIGLGAAAIGKAKRKTALRTQSRIREMLEIVARVRDWAGGEVQALAWYRCQPIPALDGRTAEALVKAGQAGAVRDYIDHIALGGFA